MPTDKADRTSSQAVRRMGIVSGNHSDSGSSYFTSAARDLEPRREPDIRISRVGDAMHFVGLHSIGVCFVSSGRAGKAIRSDSHRSCHIFAWVDDLYVRILESRRSTR